MKKSDNKLLFILVMVYIFSIIAQHSYLFIQVGKIESPTPKAVGTVRFCLNHRPTMNYTCNTTIGQNTYYNCTVEVTDPDAGSTQFDYESFFFTNVTLFVIDPYTGLINFTPNSSHVGNHSFQLTVMDRSGCSNHADVQSIILEILNLNDPPYLVQPIPNQSWNQDSTLAAFDLDTYFDDPDGDPLNYTVITYKHKHNTWSWKQYYIYTKCRLVGN